MLCRVEIYSLRVVPKRLSGKPQGWNSESTNQFDGVTMLWCQSLTSLNSQLVYDFATVFSMLIVSWYFDTQRVNDDKLLARKVHVYQTVISKYLDVLLNFLTGAC